MLLHNVKKNQKTIFPNWQLIFPQLIIILSNTIRCKGWFKNIFDHHRNKSNLFINHLQTKMGNIERGKLSRLFRFKGDLFFPKGDLFFPIRYFWPRHFFFQFFGHKILLLRIYHIFEAF